MGEKKDTMKIIDKVRTFLDEHKRIYPLIGAIIVFVLSLSVLYAGDNIGLSDNGDFRRVLLVNNLKYDNEDNYYYLFKQDYKMKVEGDSFTDKVKFLCESNKDEDIYSSPQFVVIKASKVVNYLVNCILRRDETHYDIFYLALIYILMFTLAAWGIFTYFADSALKTKVAVFIIFIVMFCDAGYLLYFNSFYGEPLQFVAVMMLIALGLLIYKRPTIPKAACFFVALYFFAGSKLANVPYAIIVSLLAFSFVFLRKDKMYRIGIGLTVIIAAIFIGKLYVSIPDWMHTDTTYQSVFFGAVKETETPEKDFKQLHIDEKYIPLINTHAYMDKDEYPMDITTPEFKKDFYDRISKANIVFFYMLHPVRFAEKVTFSISNASSIRPLNCGNSKDVIMYHSNRYSLWSNLRVASRILYKPLIVYIIAIIMTAYVVFVHIFLVRQKRETNEKRLYLIMAMYVLIAGLWINMCLPIIGNGEADIMKHMFLFTHCVDILFAGIILAMVNMQTRNKIISLITLSALVVWLRIEPPKETVDFGTYEGKPITWEIMDTLEDGSKVMVTRKCVTERTFDEGSNMWETSNLRSWLNSDFLAEFTTDEINRIESVKNEVMLTHADRGMAVSGDHTHIWSATKESVDDLSETAYKYFVTDKVYIPTLDMMKNIDIHGSFWVLCPYGYNEAMQRFMQSDGYILHTLVSNTKGVRAVIRVKP